MPTLIDNSNNIITIFDPKYLEITIFGRGLIDVLLPNDVNAARSTRHYDLCRISARAPSMQNACTLASVKLHGASITLPLSSGHERVQCAARRDSRSPRKPLLWNFVNGRAGTISVIKMHAGRIRLPPMASVGCEPCFHQIYHFSLLSALDCFKLCHEKLRGRGYFRYL